MKNPSFLDKFLSGLSVKAKLLLRESDSLPEPTPDLDNDLFVFDRDRWKAAYNHVIESETQVAPGIQFYPLSRGPLSPTPPNVSAKESYALNELKEAVAGFDAASRKEIAVSRELWQTIQAGENVGVSISGIPFSSSEQGKSSAFDSNIRIRESAFLPEGVAWIAYDAPAPVPLAPYVPEKLPLPPSLDVWGSFPSRLGMTALYRPQAFTVITDIGSLRRKKRGRGGSTMRLKHYLRLVQRRQKQARRNDYRAYLDYVKGQRTNKAKRAPKRGVRKFKK